MRTLIARLTSLAILLLLIASFGSEAVAGRKIAKVGILSIHAGPHPTTDVFVQALHELGWINDQNVAIEMRFAAGRAEAMASLAADLVALKVDVLVTFAAAGALAAKQATRTIPVVFVNPGDPLALRLVSNLARPGGNMTGVSNVVGLEIYAKRLELLKEVVPSLSRVALLVAAEIPVSKARETLPAAAKALNLELHQVQARTEADLEVAIREAKVRGAQALYIWPGAFTDRFRGRIADLALTYKLPSIQQWRDGAMAGGLLSYGPNRAAVYRRAAVSVDKILRGAKPGDLPVEQPTTFEFVINLKTAKALGLTIPQAVLLRADAVID
jgi:putative ABC transport system substrate-binding protein